MYSVRMPFLVQGGSKIPTDLLHDQLLWEKKCRKTHQKTWPETLLCRVSVQLGSCCRQISILKWADSSVWGCVNTVDCSRVQRCLRALNETTWGPEPEHESTQGLSQCLMEHFVQGKKNISEPWTRQNTVSACCVWVILANLTGKNIFTGRALCLSLEAVPEPARFLYLDPFMMCVYLWDI